MNRFNAIMLSSACALGFASSVSYGADPVVDYAGERLETMERALMLAGLVEVYGDYSFIDGASGEADHTFSGSGDSDDYFELGGAFRLSVPFSDQFSGQFDFDAEFRPLDDADADDDHYTGSNTIGLHLSYRDPASYLLGAFGGAGQVDFVDEDGSRFWFGGVEGQYYIDQVTLYAQAGFLDSDNADSDSIRNAWFVRGVGRYFLTDYSMVQADAGYFDGEADWDDDDVYGISWGLRLEHQLMSVPVSIFGAYEGNYFSTEDADSPHDDANYTEHAFLVGAKYAFGATGLKTNDRYGATLDLPSFGRWVASATEFD